MWRHMKGNDFEKMFLLVLLFLSAWMGFAPPEVVRAEDLVWSNDVELSAAVTVPAGSTLRILPGTRIVATSPEATITVKGTLLAEGTPEAPIRFQGSEGWEGILFLQTPKAGALIHVHFTGGDFAVSAIESAPVIRFCRFEGLGEGVRLLRMADAKIEKNLFSDNKVGVRNEMKSNPRIVENRFLGHEGAGILCSNNSVGKIEGNRFEGNRSGIFLNSQFASRIYANLFLDNEYGIRCVKTLATPIIESCYFEGNNFAVMNDFFAYPQIVQSHFVDNLMAIKNDRFGSSRISHNLFQKNRTAIHNNRKSQAVVEKNSFENNGLVLYSNYSSYPIVRENNFRNNAMVAYLDIHMSADFEGREGSKSIVRQESQAMGTRNPMLSQAPEDFEDFVDLGGNWWGAQTPRLAEAGAEENLDLFFDRRDMPTVRYEGYEGKTFALDRVVFQPVLKEPVADAGPGADSAIPKP